MPVEIGGCIFTTTKFHPIPWMYKFKGEWDTGVIIYWLMFGVEVYFGKDK
jgi:hypothetical protein